MAQGVVSILDSHHIQVIENLWADMRQRFGFANLGATTIPHVSFHVAEKYDEEGARTVLREIAGEKRPFTITTSGFGVFPSPAPIVYVPVVRSPELAQLHTQLCHKIEAIAQESFAHYSPDNWIPHITLGHDEITLEKLGPLSQWLHQQTLSWTITIDNFHLLTDDSNHSVNSPSVRFGE